MEDNQNIHRVPVTEPQRSRPTIGLIIDNIYGVGGYQSLLWTGITDAVKANDVNLVTFAGGSLGFSPYNEFEYQRNLVYEKLTAERIDGAILSSTTANFISPQEYAAFAARFQDMPLVSMAFPMEGIPSVTVDNRKGLHDAIAHLIEVHNHRRIAFIKGTENNADAEERYRTYVDALTYHGLPLDANLVVPGNFLPAAGTEAVRILLDERQAEFDAIMAANDNMALAAMEALQARGLMVPYDVAVVGFDDLVYAKHATPPLATIRQPIYKQGQKAVEMLLDLLAGKKVTDQIMLPTELVTRQSCGCLYQEATIDEPTPIGDATRPLRDVLTEQRALILASVARSIPQSSAGPDQMKGWAAQLVDAFSTDLGSIEADGTFLQTLDRILRQVMDRDEDVSQWRHVLSTLRRHTLPLLVDRQDLSQAADLWARGAALIGDMGIRIQASRRRRDDERSETLRDISAAMSTTFDVAGLMGMIPEQLPRLGIPACYISTLEDSTGGEGEQVEWARMVMGYNKDGPIDMGEGIRFPVHQLMPPGLDSSDKRYHLLLDSLYFRENRQGYILFELGPLEGLIYETLRAQISSSLQATMLVEQVEERRQDAEHASGTLERRARQVEASAAISQAITAISDVQDLLSKTVAMIDELFDYDYVGVYLINEDRQTLVLQEASGEAGKQLVSQGYDVAVDDTSLVGWTARHRVARVDQDEGGKAYPNHPLLPYIHSQVSLPLMAGDKIAGVLDIQTVNENAFEQDDVTLLQNMSNQIAIALENARLFRETQTTLEEAESLYRASRFLTTATATTEVATAIINSVAETGADGCLVVEFEFSSSEKPDALLYLGVWRRDRQPQFQPGLRLPISESPFPVEMVSSFWAIPDVAIDERLPESARSVFLETDARALVNIPLRSGDRIIGQVVVLRTAPGPFSQTALRLYEALSDQAAVALERAQLLERTQQRAEQEQQTRQMIDDIRRASDVERALRITAERMAEVMNVPHVAIELDLEQ